MNPYEHLTVPELRTYAADELGLSFPPKTTKSEMIKQIQQHKGEPNTSGPVLGEVGGDGERIPVRAVVHIHDDGDEGQNFHLIGVNGRNYKLKKGEDINVPWSVVDVLQNAVETIYKSVTRDNGTRETVSSTRPRIPFSVKQTMYEGD